MIRKGNTKDIKAIMELTKACAKAMIAKGIKQWNDHYPNTSAFIKDVSHKLSQSLTNSQSEKIYK